MSKPNLYNVIIDGETVHTRITAREANILTGISVLSISDYANKGKPYHDNIYFEVCGVPVVQKKAPIITGNRVDMPKEWQDEWNYWRKVINPEAKDGKNKKKK